jgi:hypothetical protein
LDEWCIHEWGRRIESEESKDRWTIKGKFEYYRIGNNPRSNGLNLIIGRFRISTVKTNLQLLLYWTSLFVRLVAGG